MVDWFISIHPDALTPEFKQLGATSGRFSCANPNVQQIPSRSELGKKLRQMFVADEGTVLVVADWSQMELRILAHYSKDQLLLQAYQSESIELQPHPFRPGAKGLSGMYFIMADDQLAEARDDLGLTLWREQVPEWSWRQLNLTELGLQQDKPMKVNDDTGNSLMMVTSHFTLGPAPLTIDERVLAQAPATWQDGYLSQLDPETAQRYENTRREEMQEIKRSLMKKRRPDYYGLGDDDEDFGDLFI